MKPMQRDFCFLVSWIWCFLLPLPAYRQQQTNSMEQLLHYVWRHKLFPLRELTTTDGLSVEVIDPGLHNRNAGPDFFNAKVRIGGVLWIGNVEVHDRSSDWYLHRHHTDDAYNNVVLHVVGEADSDVETATGKTLPQLVLPVPEVVNSNYESLLKSDDNPPCSHFIKELSPLMVHSWMSALQTERLEQKTKAIEQRLKASKGSWDDAYFVTLARSYGFGVNSDTFERWAATIPLHSVDHHRDNLFQIEAIFLGQAGLLELDTIPQQYHQAAVSEGYLGRLQQEYRYLAHKFSFTPIDGKEWRFLRLRPQNFPYIRISQLAQLYYDRHTSLASLLDCSIVEQAQELLSTHATPYWQEHYVFGSKSQKSEKRLSAHSLQLILINTVVPMLFAYGRYKGDIRFEDRAFEFLEGLKPEDNNIVRLWKRNGIDAVNAGDTQALIQLHTKYCNNKDCLRCRIGYEYLSSGFKRKRPQALVPPTVSMLADELGNENNDK